MTDRELMQQALEALESFQEISDFTPASAVHSITALRERLAREEPWEQFHPDMGNPFARQEQEPVAWMNPMNGVIIDAKKKTQIGEGKGYPSFSVPCYTAIQRRERLAQPQRTHWEGCEDVHPECKKRAREWVGLTDEEKLHLEIMGGKSDVMLAEAIEAKLKEKNA